MHLMILSVMKMCLIRCASNEDLDQLAHSRYLINNFRFSSVNSSGSLDYDASGLAAMMRVLIRVSAIRSRLLQIESNHLVE